MERVGKVFKKSVSVGAGFVTVSGFVRSKALRNIVKSIDFLDCVTQKLNTEDMALEAIRCFKDDTMESGGRLQIEEREGMTFFSYSFCGGWAAPAMAKDEKANDDEGQADGSALEVSMEVPKMRKAFRKVSQFVKNQMNWRIATMFLYRPDLAHAYGMAK